MFGYDYDETTGYHPTFSADELVWDPEQGDETHDDGGQLSHEPRSSPQPRYIRSTSPDLRSTSTLAGDSSGGGWLIIALLALFPLILGMCTDKYERGFAVRNIVGEPAEMIDIKSAAKLENAYQFLKCADGAGFGAIWDYCKGNIQSQHFFEEKFSGAKQASISSRIEHRSSELPEMFEKVKRQCRGKWRLGSAYQNCAYFRKFEPELSSIPQIKGG